MTDSPLVRVLTGHWLAGVGRDHATRRFRVRCACGQVEFGWHPSSGAAVQTWIAHIVTLLTSETQAELNRQFAGSGGITGTNGREYRVYNAGPPPVAPLAAADPGFPVLPAVAWPKGWPR